MRRRANPTQKREPSRPDTKTSARLARDADDADRSQCGVDASPTGTLCPVDGCGLPQWSCPSGVACDNGHGGADLGEPIVDPRACFTTDREVAEGGDVAPGVAFVMPDESIAGAAFDRFIVDELPAKGSISGDLGVVERDFEIDFDAEYRALKRALTLRTPADQASIGVLTRALDEAHENIRRSHVLACVADHRLEMFEIDAEIAWADLRSRAVEKLTEERKRHGARAKAITDADVRGMLAHVDPVGWRERVSKKKKIELAAEHVKKLADAWRLRATALDTMVKAKR